MKAVAFVGGLVVVAALIFMAVAGFPGAVPILISAAALVAMIGLGGTMGGRHTPNVPPVTPTGSPADHGPDRPGTDTVAAEGAPADAGAPADTDASADTGADGAPAEP